MFIENTWSRVKIKSKLTKLTLIMVNKGPIHKELGKFLMISSNLIKSDDESVIEIRKFDIL